MNVDVKFVEHLIKCNKRNQCSSKCLSEETIRQMERLVEIENKKIKLQIVRKGLNIKDPDP